VNPSDQSLILAKDPIGTRHLYYSLDREQVTWSTIFDPLILFPGGTIALNEEYIASWFASFPDVRLTPYVGIHSVPPSTFLTIHATKCARTQYWNFDPHRTIRYRSDAEYEEHFRTVFAESVRRRLRSHAPVLAELSGGMDSSSIVCVADKLLTGAVTKTDQLNTLSYYDNSEPNWNEEPYFAKVEEKRDRIGCHIDICGHELFQIHPDNGGFSAMPKLGCPAGQASRLFASCISRNGNRVVLSGLGGDEVTGGVPSPIAELGDLLAAGRFGPLTQQLMAWALHKRKPWLHLLYETCRGFLPRALSRATKEHRPTSWLQPAFVARNRRVLASYERRLKFFGPLPSFQENLNTLELLQRQLACEVPDLAYERRYPFLDRDLLEFIYAIPRAQIVRPGQRRSLLRRALVGTVPDEILNRRRKAYPSRAPVLAVSKHSQTLIAMAPHMVSTFLGIVDHKALCTVLEKARDGQEIPIVFLARTLAVESWLESLRLVSPSIPATVEFRGQRLEREMPETTTKVARLTYTKTTPAIPRAP
jgi:asparagine synthase (glutamine-hydrolysing)